jgi:hypothetical protein
MGLDAGSTNRHRPDQTEPIHRATWAMFLTIRHDDDSSLVEVLDLQQLFDPFAPSVLGRLHAGEELQDPGPLSKGQLSFPSGEALPRCWVDPHYKG